MGIPGLSGELSETSEEYIRLISEVIGKLKWIDQYIVKGALGDLKNRRRVKAKLMEAGRVLIRFAENL